MRASFFKNGKSLNLRWLFFLRQVSTKLRGLDFTHRKTSKSCNGAEFRGLQGWVGKNPRGLF
jgi:hypothetical protein